ncbi:MAG: hypothetical protein OXP70_13825, partial [Acidobacteriota bacterium]|nr:hypothetical protein [Acidobacteriota bacterium]
MRAVAVALEFEDLARHLSWNRRLQPPLVARFEAQAPRAHRPAPAAQPDDHRADCRLAKRIGHRDVGHGGTVPAGHLRERRA